MHDEPLTQCEFQVSLAGRVVGCDSLEDAIAIKSANDILMGEDPTSYSEEQLAPLAEVLIRYGYVRAAESLG
jgi:hypothetical protein